MLKWYYNASFIGINLSKLCVKHMLKEYYIFNAAFFGIDFAKLCVKHMFKEYCIRCCIYWNAFCKKDESIFQIRLDLTSRNVLRSSTFNFYIKKVLQEFKTILNVRIPETSAQRKYWSPRSKKMLLLSSKISSTSFLQLSRGTSRAANIDQRITAQW